MPEPGDIFFLALTFLVILSILYWLLADLYILDWLRDLPTGGHALPPVTLLRPVKRDTPRLFENLTQLADAMRPTDQLLLGVDADSDVALRCAEIRVRFPERDIAIIPCAPGAALNPKISKLVQMTPHARHAHWILSDSEAVLDTAFLTAFRSEWAATGADALTCGYRFTGLATWPQALDAASTLLTLWPGLAVVRRFGPVRLTLGACTAFHRADIEALGGWSAFGDELAEDNRLGAALADAGRTIRLSACVVTLASDALSWRDYWRHQRRVAITYRAANPAGFGASIITQAIPLATLASFAPHPMAAKLGALLVAIAWLMRSLAARDTARRLAFPIPWLPAVLFLASFVETACWLASWFSRRVWWGGRWWRVSARGKLRAT